MWSETQKQEFIYKKEITKKTVKNKLNQTIQTITEEKESSMPLALGMVWIFMGSIVFFMLIYLFLKKIADEMYKNIMGDL